MLFVLHVPFDALKEEFDSPKSGYSCISFILSLAEKILHQLRNLLISLHGLTEETSYWNIKCSCSLARLNFCA